MTRLGITILSTAWVLGVVIGWVWLGTTIHDVSASLGYWMLAWIPTVGVIATPFVIYDFAE